MKTIVGMFDHAEDAQSAVRGLEAAGISRAAISVAVDPESKHADQYSTGSASAAESMTEVIATDATAGAAIGGATGLFMALTGLVIPGFGTIVAAGWLVSVLAGAAVGAAAGGLVGGLTGAGIPLEDAMYYREGIRQGATLVAVRTEDAQAVEIAHIMEKRGAVNIDERGAQYMQQGLVSPTDSSVLMRPVPASNAPEPLSASHTSQPVPASGVEHVSAVGVEHTETPLIVEEPLPSGGMGHVYAGGAEIADKRSDTSSL